MKKTRKTSKIIALGSIAMLTTLTPPLLVVSCSTTKSETHLKWLKKITSEIPNRVAGNAANTEELFQQGKGEKAGALWIKEQLKALSYPENQTPTNQQIPLNASGDKYDIDTNQKILIHKIDESQKQKDNSTHGFYQTNFLWWSNPNQKNNSQTISLNIIPKKAGASTPLKDFYLVSHYDTANKNNDGTNDNSSGVAMNLMLAEYFANAQNLAKLNVNLHLIFAGAEEVGVKGTWAWTNTYLTDSIKQNILGMINLDSVAGGDYLYVHSPDSKNAQSTWNTTSSIRDDLNQLESELIIHPQIDSGGFKKGETGDWSDHAPFYKNGIPVAYIEATNFNIKGKDGFDGYSQVTNERFWKYNNNPSQVVELEEQETTDVEGNKVKVYIPKNYEQLVNDGNFTSWGKLWHTDYDIFQSYEEWAPGRLQKQMEIVYGALTKYILNLK